MSRLPDILLELLQRPPSGSIQHILVPPEWITSPGRYFNFSREEGVLFNSVGRLAALPKANSLLGMPVHTKMRLTFNIKMTIVTAHPFGSDMYYTSAELPPLPDLELITLSAYHRAAWIPRHAYWKDVADVFA